MPRSHQRSNQDMRPLSFELNVQKYAWGSVLVSYGDTRVICAANIDNKVPPFLNGKQQGWLTAEYSMLPGATTQRSGRDQGKGGRSQEIQRLIGRSLRAVTDLKGLGERTLLIDCDVLQADGGTRTAAISGSYVAACVAVKKLIATQQIKNMPFRQAVAAVSVGIVRQQICVDLCYEEDAQAEVDLNLVMGGDLQLIEVQGTAENAPFSRAQLNDMLDLGQRAISQILVAQQQILATV